MVNNAAFIDSNNLYKTMQGMGWRLDYAKFRVFLSDKYKVTKTYLFVGYLPQHQAMYTSLQEKGYILVFKPVLTRKDGTTKGNVDADLVLRAMIEYPNYDKAVIVTSDGDFYSLVEYLYSKSKLKIVLAPHKKNCSILFRKKAKERIDFLDNLKKKLS